MLGSKVHKRIYLHFAKHSSESTILTFLYLIFDYISSLALELLSTLSEDGIVSWDATTYHHLSSQYFIPTCQSHVKTVFLFASQGTYIIIKFIRYLLLTYVLCVIILKLFMDVFCSFFTFQNHASRLVLQYIKFGEQWENSHYSPFLSKKQKKQVGSSEH